MTQRQEEQHPNSTKRGKLGRIIGAVVVFGLIWLGTKFLGRLVGRQAAIQTVQQESISQNAPRGFLAAKWLMSMNAVRSLFPSAVEFAPGNLKMEADAFCRPAFVDFMFTDNLLLIIIISFKGEKSEVTYRQTQSVLQAEYGAFTKPATTDKHAFSSEKRIGRIVIEHLLYQQLGLPIEQVMLYRTK